MTTATTEMRLCWDVADDALKVLRQELHRRDGDDDAQSLVRDQVDGWLEFRQEHAKDEMMAVNDT